MTPEQRVDSYGLTCINSHAAIMPNADSHNDIELIYIPTGSVTYLLGGHKITVQAERLSLFWGSIPHQIIDFQVELPYFAATIPLHNFLQWRLPPAFVQPLMQGQLLTEKQPVKPDLDTVFFNRWVQDLGARSSETEQIVLLEMQARLSRMASTFQSTAGTKGLRGVSDAGLSKVEKMARFIAQNYTQKITVQQLAELVDLHPNYAMDLFQKTFGTTLVNYLTHHRLSHVQRLLTTTNEAITDIALLSGFQSISRFNDVFNRNFGCSPRVYRKRHS